MCIGGRDHYRTLSIHATLLCQDCRLHLHPIQHGRVPGNQHYLRYRAPHPGTCARHFSLLFRPGDVGLTGGFLVGFWGYMYHRGILEWEGWLDLGNRQLEDVGASSSRSHRFQSSPHPHANIRNVPFNHRRTDHFMLETSVPESQSPS